jgi:hypothetical protein
MLVKPGLASALCYGHTPNRSASARSSVRGRALERWMRSRATARLRERDALTRLTSRANAHLLRRGRADPRSAEPPKAEAERWRRSAAPLAPP